jgi:hypothetical protein
MRKKVTIVYIAGFLVPEGRMPAPINELSDDTTIIHVHPSGVCSLHDRVMHIFYELIGGTVHFGVEHSRAHGHSETGVTFATGKHPDWCAEQPIHLVGHSFGAITARVLHAYLAQGDRFPGYTTSDAWVISVVSMNGPLNGCLRVYGLGEDTRFAPLVRWASPGCCLSWLVQLVECIDVHHVRTLYPLQIGNLVSWLVRLPLSL